MKYCSHCGAQIEDEAVICVHCGCKVVGSKKSESEETNDVLGLVAKVFMVLACVGGIAAFFIPLAWCIPMTVHAWRKIDNHEEMGVGFKVCTLLFVSVVAGILLLCRKEEDL